MVMIGSELSESRGHDESHRLWGHLDHACEGRSGHGMQWRVPARGRGQVRLKWQTLYIMWQFAEGKTQPPKARYHFGICLYPGNSYSPANVAAGGKIVTVPGTRYRNRTQGS